MDPIIILSPFEALFAVIRSVRGGLGGWGLRGLLGQALVLLAYRRLGGIAARMQRLMARFEAGRLWQRKAGVAPRRAAVAPVRPAEAVLPVRFGWLVRAAGWQAAGYGCQLQALLVSPEMEALLRASPQAGRILRPLCRMLAVDTAILRPGRVEAAAVADAAPARVARPVRVREKPDFGRIPLPRGVLTAARRQGFGKP